MWDGLAPSAPLLKLEGYVADCSLSCYHIVVHRPVLQFQLSDYYLCPHELGVQFAF